MVACAAYGHTIRHSSDRQWFLRAALGLFGGREVDAIAGNPSWSR